MQGAIAGLGSGIAAPSANRSGTLSPTRADHVSGLEAALLLDAGPTSAGLESTIVKVAGETGTLLRPGALAAETIEAILGQPLEAPGSAVEAPGMLHRHYAPRLPLRLDAQTAGSHEFHIGFGPIPGTLNLSPAGDLAEAAANLFHALHTADASAATAIAVAPIPHHGLGITINDRLRRASET
jgi:L-threonylcarbamoyladenylate synthase